MPWQQLKIELDEDTLETVEEYLLKQGSVSVSYLDAEDQPVFQEEPGATPLWDRITLLALFEMKTDLAGVLLWLKQQQGISNPSSLSVEVLQDQNWERSWMADFKAMQFGQRLWICPSWQQPPDPEAINIILDPGLAFGSGSHATTTLCLKWLEQQQLQGLTVIDYGCGSGVLAIAAALLGAKQVIGIDNDPQAITASKNNAQANGLCEPLISAYLPADFHGGKQDGQADILLANILAEPLMQLAEKFAQLVKTDGLIVLSGLLESQAEEVSLNYSQWFEMDEPVLKDEWVRLSGRRK